MEASLKGNIFCSAPTDVAVDTLALRLNDVSISVSSRYNEGKAEGDPSRAHRRLIVRAYEYEHELDAVKQLLQFPDREVTLPAMATWSLNLSVAYWTLVVLGCKARGVKSLERDDSGTLHMLRQHVEGHDMFGNLLSVASGEASPENLNDKDHAALVTLMERVIMRGCAAWHPRKRWTTTRAGRATSSWSPWAPFSLILAQESPNWRINSVCS